MKEDVAGPSESGESDKGDEETDESERDPEAPAEPEPAAEAPEGAAAAPVDPERPLFAADWPRSPYLDRLLVAFERGNYAYVRSEAPRVAERASDPAVKTAALELRRRIDPAPLAGFLVIIAIGLLVVLAGHYLGKHNPGAPPTVAPASTNAPLQPPASNR